MLSILPYPVKGILALTVYVLNTVILCSLVCLVAAVKFMIPVSAFRGVCTGLLTQTAALWMSINAVTTKLFTRIEWDVRGLENLERQQWYLVLSNHQSWVDILVLQQVFNRKIPMLKFFLKKSLIRVPFLGLAWWALEFPFMERYSRQFIEKNPHLKGKDLEKTRRACEKFKQMPVSVMNFVEGTRFTRKKKENHDGEFRNLLKPKAGGTAFVLGAMGEVLHKIIDVTIVYPDGTPSFWEYISGRCKRVIVDIELLPITDELLGDYFTDPVFKKKFCDRLNRLWTEKDAKIEKLMQQAR
ncbi:MAG: acyltransferase [Desulfarculaceae bacterium]|nr:acyltransferase [Desulfarculaceae bacterium]